MTSPGIRTLTDGLTGSGRDVAGLISRRAGCQQARVANSEFISASGEILLQKSKIEQP
jgi:hypothetical protein